jgi:hypothetical protein
LDADGRRSWQLDATRIGFGTDTLSKLEEARSEERPLVIAKAMFTVEFMVMLSLVLNCVQHAIRRSAASRQLPERFWNG